MPPTIDQWTNARPLLTTKEPWIADEAEQARIGSYDLYEAIYWGFKDTFKIKQRGSESDPIYLPSGRTIVETLHRYLANDVQFLTDPERGSDTEKALADQVMQDFVRRERAYSKFNFNKRYGIIRGDWMFQLYADPLLPAGSRVSIFPLDPRKVFVITLPDNVDVIIGYDIAEPFKDTDGQVKVRRLTYMKQTRAQGPSPIEVTDEVYLMDKWGGPGMDREANIPVRDWDKENPGVRILPAPIDDLPIYHIPNFQEPHSPWGSSEMRGLETLMLAMNQTMSDEQLALTLEGLGVYITDAGTPVDEDGNEVPWSIAPGRVVELPEGKTMTRLQGIQSVDPNIKHMEYLEKWMQEATSANPVARGDVDVQTAESGIALFLRLAPMLAHVEEKEVIVTDVMNNLLFNLPKWLVAYEGTVFNSLIETTRWVPQYGDKIPVNRDQEITNLISLAGVPGVVPMSYIRQRLRALGYEDLPTEAEVASAIQAETQQQQDATAFRMQNELNQTDPLNPDQPAPDAGA